MGACHRRFTRRVASSCGIGENTADLFTFRSYGGIPAMTTNELDAQLSACMLDALRQQAYSPPRTPDTSITDAFYSDMAGVFLTRLKADGWVIMPPERKGRDRLGMMQPSDRTLADAEEDLRFASAWRCRASP